jgi:hypothetical protein
MIRGQTNRLRSQTRPQLIDPRLFALALVVACALLLCLGARLNTSVAAGQTPQPPQQQPQQQPRPQRRPPARRAQAPSSQALYWTRFKHERKEHFDNCVQCHVTATKPTMTFERPEIEAFPDHPACIECHRKEFFRGPFLGSAPAICADCHAAAVPPPAKAKRFEFPNPQRPAQFNDLFPHSTHQSSTALEQFTKRVKIEKPKQGEAFSCLACHQLDPTQDEKETPKKGTAIVVKAGTYYDTYTDHANCFQCHWSKEKSGEDQLVYKDDCRSCHDSVAHPAKAPPTGDKNVRAWTAAPPATATAEGNCPTVVAAHDAPQKGDWYARVSPMFMHSSPSHDKTGDKEDGCAYCHTSLTPKRKLTLAQLQLKANQVPIVAWQQKDNKWQFLSCAACHNKLRGTSDDAKLFNELKAHSEFYKQPEDKRAGQLYNCCYCHAPDLGMKQQVPCSHYLAFLNKDTNKLPPGVRNLLTDAYLNNLPDKNTPDRQCKEALTAAFAAK